MKHSLDYVVKKIPYNSLAPFMIAQGMNPSDIYGGNCLMQNSKLGALLQDRRIKTTYISTEIRPERDNPLNHYATLCRENGKTFFLDPYLYPEAPIDISDVIENDKKIQANSYPGNLIQIIPHDPISFDVCFLTRKLNENYKLAMTYHYNLSNETDILPPITSKEFTDPSRSPLLRYLISDDELISVYINPSNDRRRIVKKFADGTSATIKIEKNPELFEEEIKKLASHLEIDSMELNEHLDLGRDAFLRETER